MSKRFTTSYAAPARSRPRWPRLFAVTSRPRSKLIWIGCAITLLVLVPSVLSRRLVICLLRLLNRLERIPRPPNGAFGAAVPVAQPVPAAQHVPTATFPAAMSPAAFSVGYDAWLTNAKALIKDESDRYLIRVEAEPDSSGLVGSKIFLNNWMHHNRASAAKDGAELLPSAFMLLCLTAFVLDTILCNRGDVHIGPVPSQRGAASPARVAPARSAGRPADLGALQDAIAALDPVAQTDV